MVHASKLLTFTLKQTTAVLWFFKSDYTVEERPSEMLLIQELESGRPKPLVFVLNANLLAMVKLVNCTCAFFWFSCVHGNCRENNYCRHTVMQLK